MAATDIFDRLIQDPAQHWVLIAHGVAAYVFLIVVGGLIPVHIRLGWNIGRNRNSGILLTGSCLLLALTALGLYYIGSENARHWTKIVHWTIGLAAMLALVFHVVKGRRGQAIPPRAIAPRRPDRPTPIG